MVAPVATILAWLARRAEHAQVAARSPAPRSARSTTIRAAGLVAVAIIPAIALWIATRQPPDSDPSIAPSPTRIDESAPFTEGVQAEIVGGTLPLAATAGGEPFLDVEEGRGVTFIASREVDGSRWYLVQYLDALGYLFGWLPERSEAMSRLVRLAPAECREPTMGWVGSLEPADRLRCFGDQKLTIEGYVIEWGGSDPATYLGTPEWLANEGEFALTLAIGPAVDGPVVPFHLTSELLIPPLTPRDGPIPAERVVLEGHFDDPRAVDCRHEAARLDAPPMDSTLSELWCRQQFVVESWHLVTD